MRSNGTILMNNNAKIIGIERYSFYYTHNNKKLKTNPSINLFIRSKYDNTPTLQKLDKYNKIINAKSNGISKYNQMVTN